VLLYNTNSVVTKPFPTPALGRIVFSSDSPDGLRSIQRETEELEGYGCTGCGGTSTTVKPDLSARPPIMGCKRPQEPLHLVCHTRDSNSLHMEVADLRTQDFIVCLIIFQRP